MKKHFVVALLLCSASQAQNLRQLGMGGVLLPESNVHYSNPALYGFDRYDLDTGYGLPLGLLQLYRLQQQASTGSTDLLFFDALFHPLEWNFSVGGPQLVPNNGSSGSRITTWAEGWNASQHSQTLIPFDLDFQWNPNWHLEVTPVIGFRASDITYSDNYSSVSEGGPLQPNQVYTSSANAGYRMTLDAGLTYNQLLSEQPGLKLYGGVRNRLSVGLLRFEGSFQDKTVTGPDGERVDALSSNHSEFFAAVDPLRAGYGTHLDAGLVADLGDLTLGFGVRNLLQYEVWPGSRSVSDNGKSTTTASTLMEPFFAPEVLLNAATLIPDGENKLIVGADTTFGVGQDLGVHLGAEYQGGNLQYRAGLGFEKGFQLGLGLGADLGDFQLDFALTGHQAEITRQFVVGVAVGAKIKF
ncbi:hypothetical protein [Deinococcus roseus]|nr:hypothetical protein [Deinococcus roseus]